MARGTKIVLDFESLTVRGRKLPLHSILRFTDCRSDFSRLNQSEESPPIFVFFGEPRPPSLHLQNGSRCRGLPRPLHFMPFLRFHAIAKRQSADLQPNLSDGFSSLRRIGIQLK